MPTTTRSRKKGKVADQNEKDLKEWSEGRLSDSEMLDRWFKTDANMSGTRYNFMGSLTFDCTGVDWKDLERALDKYPDLAFIEEEDEPFFVPIIFHCLYSHDPPVPVSVLKKLITINPSLLYEHHVCGDIYPEQKPVGYSVLQAHVNVPWETSFDVCRFLVEEEPDLLLYRTKDPWVGWENETGRETLLGKYPKEGKELCDRLEASGKVDFSEENIKAVNQRRFDDMYADWSDHSEDMPDYEDEDDETPDSESEEGSSDEQSGNTVFQLVDVFSVGSDLPMVTPASARTTRLDDLTRRVQNAVEPLDELLSLTPMEQKLVMRNLAKRLKELDQFERYV